MAYCTNCGAELTANSRFCSVCGAENAPAKAAAKPKASRKKGATPAKTRKTAARQTSPAATAARSQKAAAPQLPTKFLPLVSYIVKTTIASVMRQIPSMVVMGGLAWLFHTFLLVYVNEGFSPDTFLGQFLALQGQSISGALLWMVASMLLTGLWRRMRGKAPKVSMKDRIEAIRTYLAEAPMDAYSVLAGGVGIALALATFVNSAASIVVALGLGSLIASKAGRVFSLLFRTAWNTVFSTLRRENVQSYGMAAGYMAVAASSLGMLATSVLPIGGIVPGALLLGAAVALGMQKGGTPSVPMILIGTAALTFALLNLPGMVFADDGGWREAGGTFEDWILSQGAIPAMIYGIGPAAGVSIGSVLGGLLNDMGSMIPEFDDFDPDGGVGIDPGSEPGPSSDGGAQPPLIDPETGEPLIVNDGVTYEGGKAGQVWLDGKWMDRSQAQKKLDQIDRDLDAENARIREEQRRWSDEQRQKREQKLRKDGYTFDKDKNAWVKPHEPSALDKMRDAQKARNDRIDKAADKVSKRASGDLKAEIDRLRADGNYEDLADVCRTYWRGEIKKNQEEADTHNRWATAYGVGEVTAKVTVAASRGALMVVGGPAGMAATAVSVGAVSAAQEGAETYVAGGDAGEVAKSTVAGFLSGAKDGAIGHYVNLPGTSNVVKVVLPAAADTTETYIRTGDVKKALQTGAVSAVGDMIGLKADGMPSGIKQEVIGATTSALSGGTLSVINGGDFGDGAVDGLINHVGGKIGSSAGSAGVDHVNQAPEAAIRQAQQETSQSRRQTIPTEDQANTVLTGLKADRDDPNTSPADKKMIDQHIAEIETGPRQADVINELDKSRIQRDANGDPVTDADGNVVKSDKVDTRGALDQLQDTRSSRTAKQADPELRDAIVKTRQEEIYAPADKRTIDRASENPDIQKMMQPGDKIAMDTFSTPGKPPSLGADRDGRLVIERDTGRVDSKGDPIVDKIEIPRKHWEKDAYQDFYDHSMDIVGGRENVTQDSHPEFFKRREELDYLKGSGTSQEDIDARAWGEAHNQLFTDKHHVEASADNSDQVLRDIEGRQTSNIQQTQRGTAQDDGSARNLSDAEGYARMWGEKSRFYEGNTPEAVAQSQKGIEAQLQVRQGLRDQGLEPPPLTGNTAKAMEVISRAPVGNDATPEAMARLETDLQNLGYKDTNDAMQKIASQSEGFKWSKPKGDHAGTSTGSIIRTGRDGFGPAEGEEDL